MKVYFRFQSQKLPIYSIVKLLFCNVIISTHEQWKVENGDIVVTRITDGFFWHKSIILHSIVRD